MICELNRENCWSLAHTTDETVLVAYLSRTAPTLQLKALIELSEELGDLLRIYVARDIALEVPGNCAHITGTPTYLLVCNDREQNRLLGEADAQQLKKFVQHSLTPPECEMQGDPEKAQFGLDEIFDSERT